MENPKNELKDSKPGVEAMVQSFVLRAGGDERVAEICGRAIAQEKEGGVCLPLAPEEAECMKSSSIVSPTTGQGLFVLDGNRLYTRRNWDYEQKVRNRVTEMVQGGAENGKIDIPTDGAFAGMKACQREAIQGMATHRFTIMTGGPGTGKTYTIARAVKLLREQNPNLKLGLAAPTGKAAARVKEAMETEAKALGLESVPETTTLHKLLGSNYDFVTFKHHRDNQLELEWLIVDEASMISLSMMAKLLDALPEKCRLTLVGDAFQLSSVEPGKVFGDLCRMKLVNDRGCKCELNESNRFQAGGEIDTLAGLIKLGDSAKTLDFLKKPDTKVVHYYCLKEEESQRIFNQITESLFDEFCCQTTPKEALEAMNKCRILCAVRKGPFGCEKLNDRLRKKMQKKYPNGPIPWMITRNDSALGVSNGDVGVVLALHASDALSLRDGESSREVPLALLPDREKAFASTIHKAQGSEYENVIIVLPPISAEKTDDDEPDFQRTLTRELLYTALTRVKTKIDEATGETRGGVYIFADDKSIEECCNKETKRNTGLAD